MEEQFVPIESINAKIRYMSQDDQIYIYCLDLLVACLYSPTGVATAFNKCPSYKKVSVGNTSRSPALISLGDAVQWLGLKTNSNRRRNDNPAVQAVYEELSSYDFKSLRANSTDTSDNDVDLPQFLTSHESPHNVKQIKKVDSELVAEIKMAQDEVHIFMAADGLSPGDRLTPEETRYLRKRGYVIEDDIAALEESVVGKKVPVI
jgi:hypothetical protein